MESKPFLFFLFFCIVYCGQSGPDENDRNLISAIESGETEKVRSAISDGADPNLIQEVQLAGIPEKVTPLALAAMNNRLAIVDELMAAGADVNRQDASSGNPPLVFASYHCRNFMVEKLLKIGAVPELASTKNGMVPLCASEIRAFKLETQSGGGSREPDFLRLCFFTTENLLTKGNAKPDVECSNEGTTPGLTPLMLAAARKGGSDSISALLKHGAFPDAQETSQGHTALMMAVRSGFVTNVQILLEGGAKVNIRSFSGTTVFELVSMIKNTDARNRIRRLLNSHRPRI